MVTVVDKVLLSEDVTVLLPLVDTVVVIDDVKVELIVDVAVLVA